MNNPLQCVCVNIFNQLSDLIGNFNANAAQSSTFSHTGGFGDGVPQTSIGGAGGAGTGQGDNGVFTFAVLLMVIALYFLSGRPQQPTNNKRADDDQIGRRNFDTDFYDE
jgi:hypothetical protein